MNRTVFTLFALLLTAVSSLQALEVGDPMEDKGTLIQLDDGLSVQFLVDENKKVVAYFIDDKGLIMESPAESIVFEVDHTANKNDKWRTLLVQGPDAGMVGPRTLHSPYALNTKLIIRFKEGDPKYLPATKLLLNRNTTASEE